jgi:hypothetical protein
VPGRRRGWLRPGNIQPDRPNKHTSIDHGSSTPGSGIGTGSCRFVTNADRSDLGSGTFTHDIHTRHLGIASNFDDSDTTTIEHHHDDINVTRTAASTACVVYHTDTRTDSDIVNANTASICSNTVAGALHDARLSDATFAGNFIYAFPDACPEPDHRASPPTADADRAGTTVPADPFRNVSGQSRGECFADGTDGGGRAMYHHRFFQLRFRVVDRRGRRQRADYVDLGRE